MMLPGREKAEPMSDFSSARWHELAAEFKAKLDAAIASQRGTPEQRLRCIDEVEFAWAALDAYWDHHKRALGIVPEGT